MPRLEAIAAVADRAAGGLRGRRWWLCTAFVIAYSLLAVLIGTQKPLWYDEIVTLSVCKLPSVHELMAALRDGADANPPLFHLITRAGLAVFGESPLVLRLPAILGFAALCWSIFRFVSKRFSDSGAWSGVGAVFVTGAFYYMTEARPYGLVLGFSGLALVCWQSAVEGIRRPLSIAGMTLCCAAALSCHYYGVLIIAPLFVAELVRQRVSGRLDIPVVAGLLGALLPLGFYAPLITSAATYGQNVNKGPSIGSILLVYHALLTQGPLLFVGLAALALLRFGPRAGSDDRGHTADAVDARLPIHEAIAVVVLCLTPLTALGSSYVSGAFVDRYAILTTVGFGLLFGLAVARVCDRRPALGVLVLLLVIGAFFAKEHFLIIRCLRGTEAFRMPPVLIRAANEGSVVIENAAVCPQYLYYAPPELRKRLYCVVDPDRALRLTKAASPGIGLIHLRKWSPMQVEDYDAFLDDHAEFLVYRTEKGREFAWLLAELSRDERFTVRLVARSPSEAIYHVQRK